MAERAWQNGPVDGAVYVKGRVSWIVKMTGRGMDSCLPLSVIESGKRP